MITPFGKATSADDFFSLPSTVNVSDVEVTGRLSANGPALPVTTTVNGKKVVLLFDGHARDWMHLRSNAGTFAAGVVADVYQPDANRIERLTLTTSSIGDFAAALALDGTYMIILSPATSDKGSMQVSLIADAIGTLVPDALEPSPVAIARPGQSARYTFSGVPGQRVTVVLTGNALDDGNPSTNNITSILVFKPRDLTNAIANGGLFTSTAATTVDLVLPETGSYMVLVNPSGLDIGSINLQLRSTTTGTLVMDGNTPISLAAGQNARYSFTGEAGKEYGLAVTGLTFAPSGGPLTVRLAKADGTFLVGSCSFSASGSCDFGPLLLSTTGTYLIDFDPTGLSAASFTVVLSNDAAGTVVADVADPTPVTIARPGQNARYTFSGVAGQRATVLLTGNALDDGNPSTNNITTVLVFKPSDLTNFVANGGLFTSTAATAVDVALPETGSYVVLVNPSGLDIGSINLQVRSTTTGTLVMDGNTPISLAAGQNARYSFRAEAGKGYGLAVTGLTFAPSGGSLAVSLLKADGTSQPGGSCSLSASGSCDFGPLLFATTDNYLLNFDPAGLNAASFTVVLSNDAAGTVVADVADPTPVTIARPGQNARYTFSGVAGQRATVLLTGNALDDGNPSTNNITTVLVFKPSDPVNLYTGQFDPTYDASNRLLGVIARSSG